MSKKLELAEKVAKRLNAGFVNTDHLSDLCRLPLTMIELIDRGLDAEYKRGAVESGRFSEERFEPVMSDQEAADVE